MSKLEQVALIGAESKSEYLAEWLEGIVDLPQPDGYRDHLARTLALGLPQADEARRGYLAALYTLANMELPWAYVRSEETKQLQTIIRAVCKYLAEVVS